VEEFYRCESGKDTKEVDSKKSAKQVECLAACIAS
jgi:hypothetical protein